ncbi:hypothetical protein PanWU01x14_187000 [Parasponia andersonii]|uniref:Uncharacterized protein n=1 Tax=Parasponia andersonii TaxID=3476 RepID=A0A2P5C3J2_PARAD|nr:hypothetical protein PanWU01x14_187000 [Parasponia andersonii]
MSEFKYSFFVRNKTKSSTISCILHLIIFPSISFSKS